jgi:hypothetical protein
VSKSIFAGQPSLHSSESHLLRNDGADEAHRKLSKTELRKLWKQLHGDSVVYGEGRLRSSHRLKGAVEYPFDIGIGGDYIPEYLGGAKGVKAAISSAGI